MIRLLTHLFGTRTPAAARPARRVCLSVEALETRATPSGGLTTVHPISPEANHVLKETEKRNTLTLKNLAPGNYTVSYNLTPVMGDKVLAHDHAGPGATFTVVRN
jgi:hypothetical protein